MDSLREKLRGIPIEERILKCCTIIGDLCKTSRNIRMSIPVQYDDEDVFITGTLKDAQAYVDAIKILESTHYQHHTPYMVCVPTAAWQKAMNLILVKAGAEEPPATQGADQ